MRPRDHGGEPIGNVSEQLDQKIDRAEKAQIVSELSSAVPVSAAQAFLKLGIASTVLVGALLLASGN